MLLASVKSIQELERENHVFPHFLGIPGIACGIQPTNGSLHNDVKTVCEFAICVWMRFRVLTQHYVIALAYICY